MIVDHTFGQTVKDVLDVYFRQTIVNIGIYSYGLLSIQHEKAYPRCPTHIVLHLFVPKCRAGWGMPITSEKSMIAKVIYFFI